MSDALPPRLAELVADGPEGCLRFILETEEPSFAEGGRFFTTADVLVKLAQAAVGEEVRSPWLDPIGASDPDRTLPELAVGDLVPALEFIASLRLDDGAPRGARGWGAYCLATQAAAVALGREWIANEHTRRLWAARYD